MSKSYMVGNLVRIYARFIDTSGQHIDPSNISLSIKSPDGTITTFDNISKQSTGIYFQDVVPDKAGNWVYRWETTGTFQAADESYFVVLPSKIRT